MAVNYSQLISDVNDRLAGLANAFTATQLKGFINEGKDELWKALVGNTDDYFLQSTTTTAAQSNTFAALSTSVREYTLPADCLRPRFIEVLSPAGYESVQFLYRKIHHPDFADQRRASTASGSTGSSSSFSFLGDVYFYTITGKNTLMLARYPSVALVLKVWYVRALPDLDSGSNLDETVAPFRSDITNFAVKRAQSIKAGDGAGFALWQGEWVKGIIATVSAAGPRSETNILTAAEASE